MGLRSKTGDSFSMDYLRDCNDFDLYVGDYFSKDGFRDYCDFDLYVGEF
jgi:hypothetical protein